jgi:hypothetical protein
MKGEGVQERYLVGVILHFAGVNVIEERVNSNVAAKGVFKRRPECLNGIKVN